jgi:hypothetical protein
MMISIHKEQPGAQASGKVGRSLAQGHWAVKHGIQLASLK